MILILFSSLLIFFYCNVTATTEIYTLSLHDALPIYQAGHGVRIGNLLALDRWLERRSHRRRNRCERRSEEHTSELQSHSDLVCRLLLEKKKLTKIVMY